MWKRLAAVMGIILLLQGCVPDDKGEPKNQEKEGEVLNEQLVKELLTHTNIDVNHVNNLGWTALLEAIILNDGDEKQQQTVQLLINHGADVNIPDKNNVTPLQHAREKGFKEIERILLEAGAK